MHSYQLNCRITTSIWTKIKKLTSQPERTAGRRKKKHQNWFPHRNSDLHVIPKPFRKPPKPIRKLQYLRQAQSLNQPEMCKKSCFISIASTPPQTGTVHNSDEKPNLQHHPWKQKKKKREELCPTFSRGLPKELLSVLPNSENWWN